MHAPRRGREIPVAIQPGRTAAAEGPLNEAMDRYAEGQAQAFDVLHRGLEPRLWPFLLRMTGRPAIAEDLLQETFIRIHRARGAFERGAAVVPWAYAIARNVWLDHVRRTRRRDGHGRERAEANDAPALEPATGPEADSEKAVIAQEMAAKVERVLAELPLAQREAFVLLRYEGRSVREAADILGSTPSAVKLRAFRAYETLRGALGIGRADREDDDGP
jgi:RNA polymerase sigma-70 factor (ECF subfamily)